MSDQSFILAPATVTVSFSLAPVDNINNSMMLMLQGYELSGLGDWLGQAFSRLSPEQRQTHDMIFNVMLWALTMAPPPADYPAYLEQLTRQDAVAARDAVLRMLVKVCAQNNVETSADALLAADEDTFMGIIERGVAPKYAEKGQAFQQATFREARPLLQDPPAMMAVIVDHLRYMWQVHCKAEWERNLPTLREVFAAFEQMDYSGLTAVEVVRAVTGRDVTGLWPDIDRVRELVFVPSMHVGPYLTYFEIDDDPTRCRLIFGARIPRGGSLESPALSRSDLLVRMSALADDTRLAILELLVANETLCAQDIMTRLDLSQSSASRHLRQLTATGYLVERRREVAKCYCLNTERIDDTLQALQRFFKRQS
jgi:hypothetical protein